MTDVFDAGLDTIFASAIGVDAVYTPAGGGAVPCRALSRTPDVLSDIGGSNRIQQGTAVYEVRVSDVPNCAKGDAISVCSTSYRVMNAWHKDNDRRLWLIEAAKV